MTKVCKPNPNREDAPKSSLNRVVNTTKFKHKHMRFRPRKQEESGQGSKNDLESSGETGMTQVAAAAIAACKPPHGAQPEEAE